MAIGVRTEIPRFVISLDMNCPENVAGMIIRIDEDSSTAEVNLLAARQIVAELTEQLREFDIDVTDRLDEAEQNGL